ncbi:hypothetical protein JTB14_035807 [Gonioctena quinquepunctata]|nr:hypothetical protein JTB14_035807 [Gonioctena quinquepunctata]
MRRIRYMSSNLLSAKFPRAQNKDSFSQEEWESWKALVILFYVTQFQSTLQNLATIDHEFTRNQCSKREFVVNYFQEVSSEVCLGRTDRITMIVETGNAEPFKERQYLMSLFLLNIMNRDLGGMIKLGVVEPSHSP